MAKRKRSIRKSRKVVSAYLAVLLLLLLPYNRCDLPETLDPNKFDPRKFYPKKPTPAKQYNEEKVVRVKDGDTVVLSPGLGRQPYTCRLYGIDSPETVKPNAPGQPYGREAAEKLQQLVLGKEVEVALTGDKSYDREVCVLRLNNKDINLRMIELGYAWAYKHYLKPPYTEGYFNAQRQARATRAGLWQDAKPEPPWEFRAKLKHKTKS
ncbi:nuclease [Candidatus Magnetobacterium bavaricum]|uniref:Nuclease n=1 Tax=Candidatus Magnetobacterium bavaricum TaxID=29290 RepID=A0A0F3H0S9_9BACT|nr:nuclease [Candidatus Magnetobacterium bavaricum]